MTKGIPTEDVSQLVLGTAPDSWGVWFAKDDHQVGWKQYLDEVANAGYVWTELGPQGFLPQDPAQLRDELDSRGLKVCGGTVFAALHKGKEGLDKALREFGQEAKLLAEVGAKYLVHLPEQYTDMHTGAATQSGDLDAEQWTNLTTGTDELGRAIYEEHGVELVFHPHADTHVDTQERILQFLADTDPRYVNLCLDTGHIAYCDGDNLEIIRQAPERITYVHLKFVDPAVRARVRAEGLALSDAVPLGVMVEPPYGEPAVPPLLDALARLDREVFTILEQDLYPVAPQFPSQSKPEPPATSPPAGWARSGAGLTSRPDRSSRPPSSDHSRGTRTTRRLGTTLGGRRLHGRLGGNADDIPEARPIRKELTCPSFGSISTLGEAPPRSGPSLTSSRTSCWNSSPHRQGTATRSSTNIGSGTSSSRTPVSASNGATASPSSRSSSKAAASSRSNARTPNSRPSWKPNAVSDPPTWSSPSSRTLDRTGHSASAVRSS